MKRAMVLVLLLHAFTWLSADAPDGHAFAGSNAITLSAGGPRATTLTTPAGLPWAKLGYQRIFNRFGFGLAFSAPVLEGNWSDYPDEWETDDEYIGVRQIQLDIKPIFVLSASKEKKAVDCMSYFFGTVVFRDQFAQDYEKFSIIQFLPYEAGLGIGLEARFLRHFSVFSELSYTSRSGGSDMQKEEFSSKQLDHYFLYALSMRPKLEAGLKIYL